MSSNQCISTLLHSSAIFTPKSVILEPDLSLTKVVNNIEVNLSFDHLMSGMDSDMIFTFKDTKTKESITNLQPYLGAVGHIVILSADLGMYLHVHPIEDKTNEPDAKFITWFPKSGIYKIWGQFQQEGKVFIVPFVVEVP